MFCEKFKQWIVRILSELAVDVITVSVGVYIWRLGKLNFRYKSNFQI